MVSDQRPCTLPIEDLHLHLPRKDEAVIEKFFRVGCDVCPFVSGYMHGATALDVYLLGDNHGDGKWCVTRYRRVCRGCVIARACRIFGHDPRQSNDWHCNRCQERIGPAFSTRATICHFCGTYVMDDREYDGAPHSTQDCRPDLFQHEKGDTCTWCGSWCYWDHDYDRRCEAGLSWEWAA